CWRRPTKPYLTLAKSALHSADSDELTIAALAISLGVTRPTIYAWLKLPGCPAKRVVADWQKWVKDANLDSQSLRDKKTAAEIKLLNAKLDREERRSIAKVEVDQLLLHISSRSRSMLYQFMETELPSKLDGMSAGQMRPILREKADEICDAMADLINKLEQG